MVAENQAGTGLSLLCQSNLRRQQQQPVHVLSTSPSNSVLSIRQTLSLSTVHTKRQSMGTMSSVPLLGVVLAALFLLLLTPCPGLADSPHSNHQPQTHDRPPPPLPHDHRAVSHDRTSDHTLIDQQQQQHKNKQPPPQTNHQQNQQQQQEHTNPNTETAASRKATRQKENEEFLQSQRHQLDSFQQQVFEHSLSPFSSLMQNLFSGFPSGAFARPRVEYGKTDDGKYLIAKLSLPKSDDESSRGAKRNIAYALTSMQSLQVRVETDTGGTRMTSSEEFQLPNPVAKEDMSVITAADGSIHVKMRILSDTEAEKIERTEQAAEINGASQRQAQGDIDGDDINPFGGSVRMPDMDEILDSLLGGDNSRSGSGIKMRAVAPLIIRFPSFGGNALSSGSSRRQDDDSNDDQARQYHQSPMNALFEELPSAAHSARCHREHADDRVQLRKCLCDVTPVKTRAVCYSKMVARSINTARQMDGLSDFASKTRAAAYDCVNGTEDQTQCMERVASSVVKFLSPSGHSGGTGGEDVDKVDNRLREQMRQALETDDATASHFITASRGLMVLEIVVCAVVLSIAFWVGMVYAMRRGYFGNRSGGLLSHLSSVMTQRSVGVYQKGGGGGSSATVGSTGGLPMSGNTLDAKQMGMNGVGMTMGSRTKSGDKVS